MHLKKVVGLKTQQRGVLPSAICALLVSAVVYSGPLPRAATDVVAMAEEAIHFADSSAAQLSDNPNNPTLRQEYQNAISNLALARQTVEEEFRIGQLDARVRARILGRMFRIFGNAPPNGRGSLGDAISRSLESSEEKERFIPKTIEQPAPEQEAAQTSENQSFPSPVRREGATFIFLTKDLFPGGRAPNDPSGSILQTDAGIERSKQSGKAKAGKGYNAPATRTRSSSWLSRRSARRERPVNSLKETLFSALKKARSTRTLNKKMIKKKQGLQPGFQGLKAGLSGRGPNVVKGGGPSADFFALKSTERGLASIFSFRASTVSRSYLPTGIILALSALAMIGWWWSRRRKKSNTA